MQLVGRVARLHESTPFVAVVDYRAQRKAILDFAKGLRDIYCYGRRHDKKDEGIEEFNNQTNGGIMFARNRGYAPHEASMTRGELEVLLKRSCMTYTAADIILELMFKMSDMGYERVHKHFALNPLVPKDAEVISFYEQLVLKDAENRGIDTTRLTKVPFPTGERILDVLHRAINPKSYGYALGFVKRMTEEHPDWIATQFEKAKSKKEELIELARSGAPKPPRYSRLGTALSDYLYGHSRDDIFAATIKALRPDWFTRVKENAEGNKRELLALAESGAAKPLFKTKLGRALSNYTSRSKSYDAIFDAKIRALRPDWFQSKPSEKKGK